MIAIALAIQTPGVQTRIADKAVNALSEKLDGEITFEKIHFKPFTTLVLKNVVIIGVGDHAQIWSEESWSAKEQSVDLAAIADLLAQVGL